jgi:hypothetical protein
VTPPPPPPEFPPPPESERTGWTGGRIGGSDPDETDPSPEPEADDVEPLLAEVDFELDVCEDAFAATPNTIAVAATEAAITQRVVPESRLRPSSDRTRGCGTDTSEGGSRPTGPGGGRAGRAEHVRDHPSSVRPMPVSRG